VKWTKRHVIYNGESKTNLLIISCLLLS